MGTTGQDSPSQFDLVLGSGGCCKDHDLQLCVAIGQGVAIHRDRPNDGVCDDLVVCAMVFDDTEALRRQPVAQLFLKMQFISVQGQYKQERGLSLSEAQVFNGVDPVE